MGSTEDWQMTVRPREERIAAVETRLDRSRNAMTGLQDRHGRKAVDIKGEFELMKDHLHRLFNQRLLTGFSSIEDMEDGIGLTTAERVAELTAVRQSLLETQNSELKLLQTELTGFIGSSSHGQQNGRVDALTRELHDKDREIRELQERVAQLQVQQQSGQTGDAARMRDLEERLRSQAQALNAKSAAYEELRQQQGTSVSLENQLRRTIEEKDALDARCRRFTQERESLLDQVRSLEARLSDKQQHQSNGQVDSLGQEIARWQQAVQTKTTQIEAMSDELTQLRHENAMLRKRMHNEELEASRHRDMASQQISSHEGLLDNLHRDLSNALQREQDVVKMLQESSEKNAQRQRELSEAEREIQRLKAHAKFLQDESASDVQATVRRLQGQVQQVSEERDRAVAEVTELRAMAKHMEDAKGERAEVHKELVDAKARNAGLGNRVEKLEDAKAKLEQSRTELIQEMGKLQAGREKMVQEVEALRGREREVVARQEQAEEQVEEQRSVVAHVNGVLSNMRTELSASKQKIQELEREREQMRGVLSELRDDKDRWGVETASSRQEIAALRDERSKVEGERNELQKYVEALTEKVEKLVDEAKRRQEVDQHTNQVIAKLQTSNEELQTQLGRKVAVINDLDSDKAKLLAEVAEREDEGNANVDAVKQMTNKLSEQAVLLRARNDELAANRETIQELRDELNDREAVLLRASDAEQRLVIALAAVNSKDAALIRKEEQIEALERKLNNQPAGTTTTETREMPIRGENGEGEDELLDAQATIASLRGEIDHLTDLLVDKADAKAADKDGKDNIVIQDLRSRLEAAQRQLDEARSSADEHKRQAEEGAVWKRQAEEATRAADELRERVRGQDAQLHQQQNKDEEAAVRRSVPTQLPTAAAAPPPPPPESADFSEPQAEIWRLQQQLEVQKEQLMDQVLQIEELQVRAEKLEADKERLEEDLRRRDAGGAGGGAGGTSDGSQKEDEIQRLREELSKEMLVNKEQLERNSTVMAVQQEKIAAQAEQEARLLEQLQTTKDEMSVLTEHNTMLAKALKGEREKAVGGAEYESAEVRRLQEQLRNAVERGHQIQSEKDEALQVAQGAMAAGKRIRERLLVMQKAMLRRVLSFWREENLAGGFNGWVQAHERIKMDAVLSEAVGQSESYDNLRYSKHSRVEI